MAQIDLTKYGITGTTEIVYNPSFDFLYEEELKPELEGFDKGQITELGAVNVMTGIYTGRSPKDKYIVMNTETDPNYPLMNTRLMLKGTKFREEALKDLKCELCIFLVLYAFDQVSDDEKEFKTYKIIVINVIGNQSK